MKKLLMMSFVLLTLSACSFQQTEEKKQEEVTTKNTTEQRKNSEIKENNKKTMENGVIKNIDELFKEKKIVYWKYTIKADRDADDSITIYHNDKKIKTINKSFGLVKYELKDGKVYFYLAVGDALVGAWEEYEFQWSTIKHSVCTEASDIDENNNVYTVQTIYKVNNAIIEQTEWDKQIDACKDMKNRF